MKSEAGEVRMALGASRTGILLLILRKGMMLAVFGVVLGSAGALEHWWPAGS